MAHTDAYERIAQAALDRYAVVQKELRFLGHSGNVTFYVEAPEENFLLRIHQPLSGLQDDIWQKPDVIQSELLWLVALHRETNITVQEPVQNLEGTWVTQVLADATQDVFNCSLLRWIDGCISDTHRTPQQAHQLGSLMGQLHRHSRQWKLPQNFVRPIFDENRLRTALLALYPAVSHGLISPEHYKMLTVAIQKIESMMKTLGQAQDVWGLIHADLHESNYLFYNGHILPIDFARCGFGYYLYDIAESIQYLLPQVRFSFFKGYQTICQLPDRYLQIVEGFFIMAIIYNYSFLLKNPEEHKWISDDIQHIAKRHLRKYLEGEPFLLHSQETQEV
ncbi:phosphotransferase [Scytonema sp. UIC 10036]|uniref:phosphotransferase enzyme family protein n=1 Tax=Scytonema sp. UIC 10036 TaxID=2304196 RepID=UPI0012DA86B1|nr:phosphotransferase [Scytonema sp. UIC 10036]MUG96867.1 phosphotransferase [Scytonema sp. UIC 10036]